MLRVATEVTAGIHADACINKTTSWGLDWQWPLADGADLECNEMTLCYDTNGPIHACVCSCTSKTFLSMCPGTKSGPMLLYRSATEQHFMS